jgi:class 3 adenylate cyclase
MSSSVLSITSAGQVYFFELRPAAEQQMLPATAIHPVAPEARQSLKTQLDHTIQLLYHFYSAGAPPDELATQPDQLKSLGRLIYGGLLPEVIRDTLKQLPLDQPLILSTNDAEFPWELAFDGQQYLSTRWPVGRELKLLSAQQPRQNTPPPRHSWKALFIGNPTGDLPATSEEVEALRGLMEHHLPQAEVYLLGGPGATKQKVRMELASGEYRVIHYSGHAAFEKDDPARSGLVLADGEILTAREIQECLDGQPWVFLNACASVQELLAESGQPVYTGVEAHGLASAFILGGARAVIGTLWPVPDQGASAFASAVYNDLLAGVSVGEALRHARHTSWRERPLDPIWAAYVLYGLPDLSLVEVERPERHLATILMARLLGLEVLQERLPLERVAEVADQVVTSLAQQVERYGGEVIRAEQDRLTAAFGLRLTGLVAAEVPSDDPAERALHAALALQRTARQVLQTISGLTSTLAIPSTSLRAGPSTSLPLDVALGLGTGTIVLSRASGSLLGPAAEDAAWLAEQAEPGQILAAETVLRAARDLFVSASWSNQALATLPAYLELQAVHEVLGPRAEFLEGFLGPLIGREQELQQLTDSWREAQQGHGRIINVIGEAGIGKSRLVHEFGQRLASGRCPDPPIPPCQGGSVGGAAQWVMVRCPPPERAVTYALVAALLRSLLELETGDDPTTVRQAIQMGLARRPAADAGDMSTSTAVLCAALGLPPAEGDSPLPSDPLARRGQLVRSLRQLLAGMMAQRPLVLILEDLHKVDELSAEVLGRLAEGIDQQPLLLLAVYRPDWQPPWSGRRYATSMVLGQLSRDESATLVSSHFQNLLPSEIAEAIADWTGGNPLFVAEVVRTLREGGALIRRDGAWLLTRPLAEIQIPPSIQGVIQDRVGRLSRSMRQMIQAAATLGVEFSRDLLAGMLKGVQNPAVIEDNLQNLERRDFLLYDWARAELRFTHDLVQAAVYADMTAEEQRVYHHRAAQA